MTETSAIKRRLGKWSHAGVPHKGWRCVDVEDLGEPSTICEMCETMEIRYVHIMEHDDWTGTLRCGCVCAGHMEQDLKGAKRREAGMKSRARRRAAFPQSPRWKHSREKGTPYIKVDGIHVMVMPRLQR